MAWNKRIMKQFHAEQIVDHSLFLQWQYNKDFKFKQKHNITNTHR